MVVGMSGNTILCGRPKGLIPRRPGKVLKFIFKNLVPLVVWRSQDTILCGRGLIPSKGRGRGGIEQEIRFLPNGGLDTLALPYLNKQYVFNTLDSQPVTMKG